ncbi:gamma-glutamyl-gamma-aminobutyrate hydrolase family protein [Kroppenstedtia pulmonis]|uniref:Gamma-glutamyl-gamma-aminobutyrate hydrolase family protein n=1 Tax=Kroppenstedtia pulmonis TaxID=1380685 RepID=A0A7D3XKC4_9BACL|nr:gamma-glutamyl-gamma-aminobutyrate hydrolase family protein [Kroppenstedtia pulmonis]QKG85479.1 gamma-glutamyl-gamma-aminobutyrate hydrolase family protein [Kroppenstedtia pulmonis]
MKPVIGITANYSTDETIGLKSELGVRGQEWQILAHDYIHAVEQAGGTPVILPLTQSTDSLHRILSLLDGILFSGGSDIDPQHYGELPRYGLGSLDSHRDQHELMLVKKALDEMDIPVLGICRGFQLMNVARGGTLYQDLRLEKPDGMNHALKGAPKYHPVHTVSIREGSKLRGIFGQESIGVNSFNHQGIKKLGEGFEVTMSAPDGLTEGIEMVGERFVVAVQWHPEMMVEHDPMYQALFKRFVLECQKEGI